MKGESSSVQCGIEKDDNKYDIVISCISLDKGLK